MHREVSCGTRHWRDTSDYGRTKLSQRYQTKLNLLLFPRKNGNPDNRTLEQGPSKPYNFDGFKPQTIFKCPSSQYPGIRISNYTTYIPSGLPV